MASSFNRWEKDPFFSAAEEVQESADRMESMFRTWIHANKVASSGWDSKELRRDLCTSLGTTKWQLEEFARAVKSNYIKSSIDDARDRHKQFIIAIEDQILKIEMSLEDSARTEGKASLPWVCLDEGECNELALFLSGPSMSDDKALVKGQAKENEVPLVTVKEPTLDYLTNSSQSVQWDSLEAMDEKPYGHRRTASACADVGTWNIAISDDGCQQNSSKEKPTLPPRKIPSVSGFLNSMESVAKLKLSKNGIRKWKSVDRFQEADTALLKASQLTRGINACYEKSKSCLDSCDDCYDKQLYGWYGSIHRLLQRSQYQMQYCRPVQVALWIVLLLCLIGLWWLI
ncbi:uncharacterized protein LOC123229440 isoform X3 [Mangifera indica]|uniref:uncharacterized protein LOC123229440 isoform X3 n=1 Tax=Mangifera indica TaxID=29780 RepID=UPI001CFA19BC|nr:uncharacterized protein LOC123229440 isoform X3 [Mangifera indica]